MNSGILNTRQGEKKDIPQVFELIKELAIYEKALIEVEITPEQLIKDGFGNNPLYGFIVAEQHEEIFGMAFYYFRYSTWKGKRLYLEDIIVSEQHRGKGIGGKLFEAIMQKSIETNCTGMMWAVLNWNEPAIKFYEKYKAKFDPEWIFTNLSKEQILENLKNV